MSVEPSNLTSVGGIIQEAFDALDWDPAGSTTAMARCRRFVNRAVQELIHRAPSALLERVDRLRPFQAVESASAGDTVAPLLATDYESDIYGATFGANAWVFRTTHQSTGYTGATEDWDTERAWDGCMVELTAPDGTVHVNQIRTVWRVTIPFTGELTPGKTVPAVDEDWQEYRFSLVHPWPEENGAGPFTWRVFSPTVTLPHDIVEVKSVRRGSTNDEITFALPDQVDQYRGQNYAHRFAYIEQAYRAPPVSLKAPAVAPVVQASEARWLGPEPPGTFRYWVTYTWGRVRQDAPGKTVGYYDGNVPLWSVNPLSMSTRDPAHNRNRRPRWESGPSPASESITVAIETSGEAEDPVAPTGVDILLPNIEYLMGFMLAGSGPTTGSTFERASVARSGIHCRIYRQRVTADLANYAALGVDFNGVSVPLNHMDIPADAVLLAEVRIDPDNEGIFTDQGTILPDYSVPLTSTGVHSEIGFWPAPLDTEYVIRYIAAPAPLVNDSDTIPVSHVGRAAVLAYVTKKIAAMNGETDRAAQAELEYRAAVGDIAKRSTMVPEDQPIQRVPGRARRSRRWPAR